MRVYMTRCTARTAGKNCNYEYNFKSSHSTDMCTKIQVDVSMLDNVN